ncbi:MAG: acyltransferase [Pseudomonadota bacterium]
MSDSKQDFAALTTFRAIGALCVIQFHAWAMVSPAWSEQWLFMGFVLWPDYFFALSGFILMHVYGKTLFKRKDSLYNFFVHRIARIYPLHVFVLLALIVFEAMRWLAKHNGVDVSIGGEPFLHSTHPKYIITNLLLIQAWGVQHMNSWNVPAWSISAEFACYLVFPIFIRYNLIGRKLTASLLVLLAIGGLILIQATRRDFDVTYSLGAVRALSSFTLGCVLYQYLPTLLKGLAFIPPALLQGITLIAVVVAYKVNALPLIYIPLWLLLIASFTYENTWIARSLSWGPFVQLGEMSYSLYMVHVLVLVNVILAKTATPDLFNAFIAWPPVLILLALWGATIFISIFTYRYIEKPGRAFVRKRFDRKSRVSPGEVEAGLRKTG